MMNLMAQAADAIVGSAPTATPAQPLTDPSCPMRALAWKGKQDIQYIEAPRPLITDQRDIVLKVTATTICGSDLHLYTGAMPNMHSGDIPGHEFMGIVISAGSEVQKIKVGARVVVAFDIACGNCDFCKREEYTACSETNPSLLMENMYGHRSAALYGYSHLTGGVPGGQAEYVRVPFADVNCLEIPAELSDEQVLYLSDVVPTAYHGTELARVSEGDKVGVWGLGPVGIMAAKWCQVRKAGRVIGIDCVPERLDFAKKMGIEVLNFKEVNVLQALKEMTGGLDAGIECAGFEYAKTITHKVEMAIGLETDTCDILSEMIYAVRPYGRIGIIGVYSGYTNHFPIGAMMEKQILVQGGQSPTQKHWKMCLEKIQKGEIDPTFMITHRGTLAQGPELYKQFHAREDGMIKVFLRPVGYQPESKS